MVPERRHNPFQVWLFSGREVSGPMPTERAEWFAVYQWVGHTHTHTHAQCEMKERQKEGKKTHTGCRKRQQAMTETTISENHDWTIPDRQESFCSSSAVPCLTIVVPPLVTEPSPSPFTLLHSPTTKIDSANYAGSREGRRWKCSRETSCRARRTECCSWTDKITSIKVNIEVLSDHENASHVPRD